MNIEREAYQKVLDLDTGDELESLGRSSSKTIL